MKKILTMAASLVLAAVILVGCGGSTGTSKGYAEDTQLVQGCVDIAGDIVSQVLSPRGTLYLTLVAEASIDGNDVLVFQALSNALNLDAGGFVAVAVDKAHCYASYDSELKSAVFYGVVKNDAGRYEIRDGALVVKQVYMVENGLTSEQVEFNFSIPDEWLQQLRNATYTTWAEKTGSDDFWCRQYSWFILTFFGESGAPVPAAYADADNLKTAIDGFKPGDPDNTLVFDLVCELFDLKDEGYYELLVDVMDYQQQ